MKIRINQDVTFNWKLTVGGESVDLSKLELSVEITTPSNKKTEITPNIQFDTLEFNYRPKQVGEYILSAYLNRFKDGETALDIKAFEGVKYTWNQDFSTDDNLEANYVELAGDFNFVPSGPDVPSVDLSDYAKITYVDTQINNEATSRTQADSELQSKINTKQDKIIAGTGINITDNTISCTIDTTIFKVVGSLPATPPSSDKNKIHLVLSSISGESNSYDEYLWVNNSWEKIGTFIPSVDLSDYATTSYVDTQINGESTARIQADSELQSKINSKQDTLTAGENIKIENNVISAIGGGTTDATELSVKITWAGLKALVDNSKLVVGQQYRITDYTCTTTQAATKSAGHVFDIIVTADSESVLNEEARAIKHDGDTYFTDCDLNAWKIWYSIDNDTNRFAWADGINGKGVIYRMIDEFNNDVAYDFKNIQFYRQWDDAKQLWRTISNDNTGVPCYTFSSEGSSSTVEFTDMSLSASNNVYSNVIRQFIKNNKQTLNNICFFGTICNKNTFGADCWENTFGNKCSSNAFGSYCFLNSFGNECNYNSFESEFNQNSFGDGCSYNLFGSGCYINSFGSHFHLNSFGGGCHNNSFDIDCYLNSFGSGCHNNSFGGDCDRNSFGSDCNNNSFGNNCDYNSFENNCYSNSFRSNCNSNSFGNNCYSNSFGSNCYSNSFGGGCSRDSFGNSCSYNSFGNSCNYIRFAPSENASNKYSFYSNNHFGDSCSFILFKGAETASTSTQVQNYNFSQGLRGQSGNAYLTIDGKRGRAYDTYISVDTNGTIKESVIAEKQDKLIAGENIKIENNVISAIRGGTTAATELLVKIRWEALKALISNSQLVPGQQYRIIDYTCTTTQYGTKSVGHPFDIIVLALSESELSERAWAIQQEGDEYFANSDLNAWQIWYCIDNDTNRFAWADSVNGKGVIYRMIDEFNNDVPYDFKNIQFYRQWDYDKQLWCIASNNINGVPCYTFSSNGDSSTASFTDMSLSASNAVYSNVIKEYISSNKQTLNNICFFGTLCNKNTFDADCRENTFGNKCSSNVFGGKCYSNSFGAECITNSFGSDCYSNSFGKKCISNSFGNSCYSNSFESNCYYNSFGNNCYSNSFGSNCISNSFDNYCYLNSFNVSCSYNSFGNNCDHNSFGSDCYSNSFGNNCDRNSFGSFCYYNSFGNSCNYIRFAPSENASNAYSYYRSNHFGNDCWYIIFKGTETASAESQVKNYNFAQGLQGTSSAYLTIDGKRNRTYDTKVAKNSSGTLKIYCEADLSR